MKVTFRCPPELEGLLPPPVPARNGLPDWLRRMPASAVEPGFGGDLRTVKQCPPFVDAMQAGFMMPLAADLRVASGRFDWDWTPPPAPDRQTVRAPIALHQAAQVAGSPLHDPDAMPLKFTSFWTIGLEPGWSLLVMHPVNRADLPFRTLTGLVDADLFRDAFIHFPALWTDRGFDGVLPAGTPVAQCLPVPRGALDLDIAAMDGEESDRFAEVEAALHAAPGIYRRRFRAGRTAMPGDLDIAD